MDPDERSGARAANGVKLFYGELLWFRVFVDVLDDASSVSLPHSWAIAHSEFVNPVRPLPRFATKRKNSSASPSATP